MEESWLISDDCPTLGSDEVLIWRADLASFESKITLFQSLLSEDENQRAERYHSPLHRSHYIACHGILRSILSQYTGQPAGALQFSQNDYGKPYLKEHPKGISFSLSRTNSLAIYGITLSRRIGIDIEMTRSDVEFEMLAKRFFASNEIEALCSYPADQKQDAFFRCWTRNEAYAKAVGQGLSLPLSSFEVSLDAKEQTQIRTSDHSEEWTVFSFCPFSNTVAALVTEGKPLVRFRHFV